MSHPQDTLSVRDVGKTFVDFYHALGYQIMSTSSLLSDKLPMTFVMSAGMVQFEELAETRRSGDHYVLIQNCFRHFDIENVGNSAFHLSLFQMSGAFDFGPIDHHTLIFRIWGLLTGCYQLNPERLFATYFSGGEVEIDDKKIKHINFPVDIETAAAWQAAGLPADHILGMDGKQNFWKQSENMVGVVNSRKCGPTAEVFYDRGAEWGCEADCRPGCSCGRYVEFMNNVLIAYSIDDKDGRVIPLLEPFVETVIGLERMAALLQCADSVYEIDNLLPLIKQVRSFARAAELAPAERARHEQRLVDHLRALLFLIKDGAPPPDKQGRQRLMRILMREMLTSQRLLGISDTGFYRSMLYLFGELYPELTPAHLTFREYLDNEENFRETLEKGFRQFEKEYPGGLGQRISGEKILHYEKELGIPSTMLFPRLQQKHIEFNLAEYQSALANFRKKNDDDI